jgi:hypothetical protein
MSPTVRGAAAWVCAALHDAFGRAVATGQVVMAVTLFNACPVEEGTPSAMGHL